MLSIAPNLPPQNGTWIIYKPKDMLTEPPAGGSSKTPCLPGFWPCVRLPIAERQRKVKENECGALISNRFRGKP